VARAGLGVVGPDRPGLPHRGGQDDRAHRVVHRAWPVVASHPLRGRVGRPRLPRHHRRVGVGAGLLNLAIAVLVVWAVPSTRDRVLRIDPTARGQRRWGGVISGLDWLARFRVEPAAPGYRLEVVDRNGTTIRGAPALALALSRLPPTAWFALPALLLPAVRLGPPCRTRRRVRARAQSDQRTMIAVGPA
jgi:hypothetical protein